MAALPDKDKRIAYAIIRHLQSQVDSRAVTGEAAEGVSGKRKIVEDLFWCFFVVYAPRKIVWAQF